MSLLTRETIRSFRRAPMLSALSITTIAFSLFTVGLFGLVAVNMREALRGISTRVQIEAFLLRGTPPETITLASQDIAAFPEVEAVLCQHPAVGNAACVAVPDPIRGEEVKAFVLPVGLPYAAQVASLGGADHAYTAAAMLVFVVMMLVVGRRHSDSMAMSSALRFSNDELVRNLTAARATTETVNEGWRERCF